MTNKPAYFKFCFLSGDPNGIAKCAYDRAAIVSYKIPRDHLKDLKELEGTSKDDFANPGIYMLIGKPTKAGIPIYVGQAAPRKGGSPFYSRLSEHNTLEKRTREWWTTALVFMDATKNSQRINETGLKYLENLLYSTAKDAKSLDVRNGNEPPGGSPDESMQSVLDDVFEGIRMCAKVLGFSGDIEIAHEASLDAVAFHGHTVWGDVNMLWDGEEKYTLLAGSAIRTTKEAASLSKGSLKNRHDHETDYMPDGKLKKNIDFSSASAAAEFAAGTPVAGPDFWKNDDGVKMKDLLK